MKIPLFFLVFLASVRSVAAANATVGSGTIAVIVMIGVSFIVCLFSRGTTNPLLVSFIGAMLPVITFIIVYLFPKETNSTDKSQDSRICCDDMFRVRIIFLIILIAGAVIALLWKLRITVFVSHYARKAASGYQQKRKEEINRQKQFLKLMKEQGEDEQQGLLQNGNAGEENNDRDFSKNTGPDYKDVNQMQPPPNNIFKNRMR